MNRGRDRKPIKLQRSLLPDLTADVEPASVEPASLPLEDAIEIRSNVCMQRDMCYGCGRGDRYGIPLHFILHFPDGKIQTVCYTCGKTAAGKTGIPIPHTESDMEAEEAEADLRLISIARKKMDTKNE